MNAACLTSRQIDLWIESTNEQIRNIRAVMWTGDDDAAFAAECKAVEDELVIEMFDAHAAMARDLGGRLV